MITLGFRGKYSTKYVIEYLMDCIRQYLQLHIVSFKIDENRCKQKIQNNPGTDVPRPLSNDLYIIPFQKVDAECGT